MQDGGAGADAHHGGAGPEANLIFVLPPNVYVAPPVGGTFWFLGNPAGRMRGSRNKLSEEVICALLRDFRKHGEKAVAQVRRTQPAAYLKICALLVPREMKLEPSGGVKAMT